MYRYLLWGVRQTKYAAELQSFNESIKKKKKKAKDRWEYWGIYDGT